MARIARIVVPDIPHHVTQRGNRRQPTFFEDADYEVYRELTTARGFYGYRAAAPRRT